MEKWEVLQLVGMSISTSFLETFMEASQEIKNRTII
jgi:hypothetical protein